MKKLASLFVEEEWITAELVPIFLQAQRKDPRQPRIGELICDWLVRQRRLNQQEAEKLLYRKLAQQQGVQPFFSEEWKFPIDDRLRREYVEKLERDDMPPSPVLLCPIGINRESGTVLYLADFEASSIQDEIHCHLKNIFWHLSSQWALATRSVVERFLEVGHQHLQQYRRQATITSQGFERDRKIELMVDFILESAVEQKASDVEIKPSPRLVNERMGWVEVFFHVNGERRAFKPQTLYDLEAHPAVALDLKRRAGLDVTRRFGVQDGKLQAFGEDFRVSVGPISFDGERYEIFVLRRLDPTSIDVAPSRLILKPEILRDLENASRKAMKQGGMLLITGPTGSGKTTTLYSWLLYLYRNLGEPAIRTLEDPIEYQRHEFSQTECTSDPIELERGIRISFEDGLRMLLRQAPKVILVGELRTAEAALLAFQLANTGHLVLSTLHTNGVVETFTRLMSMDVPLWMVTSLVKRITAQRLVRRLCPDCKVQVGDWEWKANSSSPCELNGCERGYRGRVSVVEYLKMVPEIHGLVANIQHSQHELHQFISRHFDTLETYAYWLMKQGITDRFECEMISSEY